jgi:hypothetical protein
MIISQSSLDGWVAGPDRARSVGFIFIMCGEVIPAQNINTGTEADATLVRTYADGL